MSASYAISLRRAGVLPTASLRFRVTLDTLAVRLTVPNIKVRRGLAPPSHKPATTAGSTALTRHAPYRAHTHEGHDFSCPSLLQTNLCLGQLNIVIQFKLKWNRTHTNGIYFRFCFVLDPLLDYVWCKYITLQQKLMVILEAFQSFFKSTRC